MKRPDLIKFKNDSKTILCRSFKAVSPEEGCSILIGRKQQPATIGPQNIWQIIEIWPCCNSWETEKLPSYDSLKLNRTKKRPSLNSKANRFFIDPREQLTAQRWCRAKDYQILGFAHSHPNGDNKPSSIDLEWHNYPGLMIIVDKYDLIEAWWIKNKKKFHRVQLL